MYVWDETEGGRGSQDVTSCVAKHLKENAGTHHQVILYCDSCTGQNRNIKMGPTFLRFVQDPRVAVKTIDLKFMVSGHSFLPNDAEFGVIESASKKQQNIFVPQDWFDIVRNAKRRNPRFTVLEMQRHEFKSTAALEEAVSNRKKDIDNGPVNWLKIRWLCFEKGQECILSFKKSLSDVLPFRKVNLTKTRNVGKPLLLLLNIQQESLYNDRRPEP